MAKNDAEVSGTLILSFLTALIRLQIFSKEKLADDFHLYKPDRWYPIIKFQELFGILERQFENPVPVKEQVGTEFIKIWFDVVADSKGIKSGFDFLRNQEKGYARCARGDNSGDFKLVAQDESKGTAVVMSTTPFCKDFERGIILGGIALFEKERFAEVSNSEDSNRFQITLK